MAVVLLTDSDFGDASIERDLLESHDHELLVAADLDPATLATIEPRVDAVLVQYAPVDSAMLRRFPSLRIVSRYGVGVDNVDLAAAAEAGVCVANVPAYGIDEVALHAVALLLAQLRALIPQTEAMRRGAGTLHVGGLPPDPAQVAVGIVGLGRIGRRTAELIAPLVGEVVGFDDQIADEAWPEGVPRATSIEDLASRCNAISVHVPLTDATRGLIGARQLELMRTPSYVVNTARAGVIDESALLNGLMHGRVAGAGLDVLGTELASAKLRVHPQVVLTSHSAWLSAGAMRRLREGAVQNILEWLETGSCTTSVPPVLGTSAQSHD